MSERPSMFELNLPCDDCKKSLANIHVCPGCWERRAFAPSEHAAVEHHVATLEAELVNANGIIKGLEILLQEERAATSQFAINAEKLRARVAELEKCLGNLQAAVVGHINGIPSDLQEQLEAASAALQPVQTYPPCDRDGCGHPESKHDPKKVGCTAPYCACRSYMSLPRPALATPPPPERCHLEAFCKYEEGHNEPCWPEIPEASQAGEMDWRICRHDTLLKGCTDTGCKAFLLRNPAKPATGAGEGKCEHDVTTILLGGPETCDSCGAVLCPHAHTFDAKPAQPTEVAPDRAKYWQEMAEALGAKTAALRAQLTTSQTRRAELVAELTTTKAERDAATQRANNEQLRADGLYHSASEFDDIRKERDALALKLEEATKEAEEFGTKWARVRSVLHQLFIHEQRLARDGRDPVWTPDDEARVREALKVDASLPPEAT